MTTSRKLTALVTAVMAVSLAVAGTASAYQITDPRPTLRIADLAVVSTTSTSVTIKNKGTLGTGAFSVQVSSGLVEDGWLCKFVVPPIVRDVSGLGAGATVTISFNGGAYASSTDRRVRADYLNQVFEPDEANNYGTIPGAKIVC